MPSNPLTPPSVFTPELAVDLWYQALREEIGLVIEVPNPLDIDNFRTHMYQARQDMADPRLAELTMYVPADASRIILKRDLALEQLA